MGAIGKKGLKPRTFSAINLLGYILLEYLYSSSALINACLNPIFEFSQGTTLVVPNQSTYF